MPTTYDGIILDQGAAIVNVKSSAYGAKGDCKWLHDGAIMSGTKNLSSASGPFAAGDVGKSVRVSGAGPSGSTLVTTVQAYTSSTQVTLAASASTTVSGSTFTVGDDTAAIQAAINALPAGGGIVYLPPGAYVVNNTIDLTGGSGQQVTFAGAGVRATLILTWVSSTAGINAASGGTRFPVVRDFTLYQSAGALPSSQRAGNYGIRNTGGVGFGLTIERVEVNYFAKAGIRIEGGTGPVEIRYCSIQQNAGYGIEVMDVGGESPQDVRIVGGNIQTGWGGVTFNAGHSCVMEKVDIELNDNARLPCVNLDGGSTGIVISGCSLSVGASASMTPSAIINFQNCQGMVVIGGVNVARNGADNLLFGAISATNNSIVGGIYQNKLSGGGYFANFTGGTNTLFLEPFVAASAYTTGKNIVHDSPSNFSICIGVNGPSVARYFAAGGGSLPPVFYGKGILIQNNANSTDHARLYLLHGSAGAGTIDFGTAANSVHGQIVYDLTGSPVMTFRVNQADKASLTATDLSPVSTGLLALGTSSLRWDKAWLKSGLVCTNAPLPTNATSGFLYIPICAGAPTGTPVSQSGNVPVVYDSVNNRLCVYNNGWKKVGLA